MKRDSRSHGYVSPVGRVRYSDDLFEQPAQDVVVDEAVGGLEPTLVERFHALVEEVTTELMSAGSFDRDSCRADAIALLTAASDRLYQDASPESPLNYLLMEERQKAEAALDPKTTPRQPLTFLKA
jgi:hypothetical protein